MFPVRKCIGDETSISPRLGRMKSKWTIARVVLGTVLLAVTFFTAGFLAYAGARVGGMSRSRSDFDLLPTCTFILAGVTGVISFGPVAVWYHRMLGEKIGEGPGRAMIVSVVAISMMALPSGFVAQKGLKFYETKRSQAYRLSREREEAYFDQIRNDPAVVVRERWFAMQDERKKAYERLLVYDSIAYDGRILGELYVLDSARSPLFLVHPSIDDELLEKRFEHALEGLTK